MRKVYRVLSCLELCLTARTAPARIPASAAGHSPHLCRRASHPDQSVCILPRTQVELKVNYIKVVSRAAVLPFEIVDAARSEVRWHGLEGTWEDCKGVRNHRGRIDCGLGAAGHECGRRSCGGLQTLGSNHTKHRCHSSHSVQEEVDAGWRWQVERQWIFELSPLQPVAGDKACAPLFHHPLPSIGGDQGC